MIHKFFMTAAVKQILQEKEDNCLLLVQFGPDRDDSRFVNEAVIRIKSETYERAIAKGGPEAVFWFEGEVQATRHEDRWPKVELVAVVMRPL